MTSKQADKVRILRAKIEAGAKVKESDWPAWQKACAKSGQAALGFDVDYMLDAKDGSIRNRSEDALRGAYLTAMGFKYEDDANPAALYWDAYHALESGIRCNTCGRPGVEWCQSCRNWLQRISDRKRIRIVTPQVERVA